MTIPGSSSSYFPSHFACVEPAMEKSYKYYSVGLTPSEMVSASPGFINYTNFVVVEINMTLGFPPKCPGGQRLRRKDVGWKS